MTNNKDEIDVNTLPIAIPVPVSAEDRDIENESPEYNFGQSSANVQNDSYTAHNIKNVSKKKILWITIAVILISSVISFFGGFFQMTNRNGDHEHNHTHSVKMTQKELQNLIAAKVPDQGESLKYSSTPQWQALDWLYLDMQSTPEGLYTEQQIIQRYVLAVLYYSTTGDGWDKQLSFLTNDHECDWEISDGYIPTWYGSMSSLRPRKCDDEDNIVSLSFRNNDLLGTIPEELALFTNLQFLTFQDNPGLSGPLPTRLGLLTKLQMLRVVDTQINGNIPTEFGKLRLLDNMDLSANDLSGPIPTELGRLTSLSGLWINRYPRIVGNVPAELGSMRSAETISISNTGLTGVVPEEVCGIRGGRVSITSVCDQSQLVCCCCNSCCDENGCTGYGGGNICENDWSNECEVCDGFQAGGTLPPTMTPIQDDGTGTSPPTFHPTTSILSSEDYQLLDYNVVDAEYSKTLDQIILVSSNPPKVHVYDPKIGKEIRSINLDHSPTCVSVGPSGNDAAVGHDAWVSYVDLTGDGETSVQTFEVSTIVFDIVLGGNGYIYAFPLRDQWVAIHSVDIATGTETLSASWIVRAGTRAKLHPSGMKIYGTNNGLSPSDIERYDISSGTAEYSYNSPYHGNWPISGDLWFSEDGGLIYVKGRTVLRSSDNKNLDMTYRGTIGDSDSESIQALGHSSRTNTIVLIPTQSKDDQIEIYNDSFLDYAAGTLTLPRFRIQNGSFVDPHGKFIFFDSNGETFHAIVQGVDDHAIITIPTNILEPNDS